MLRSILICCTFTTTFPVSRVLADDRQAPEKPDTTQKESKKTEPKKPDSNMPPIPKTHIDKPMEGWTIRVDDRLLEGADAELGKKCMRVLESKLIDIKTVLPADKVEKLQKFVIVLDLTHGGLKAMQYHPGTGWLKENGYSPELVKCVHIPRAADLISKRTAREQPWVILHELSHAYHDQVLGFDDPRIKAAYEDFRKSGRGDKTLLFNGDRVKHYALTTPMEFFAEMTEAYFGTNDFYPFNRAELKESEMAIYELLAEIWDKPKKK